MERASLILAALCVALASCSGGGDVAVQSGCIGSFLGGTVSETAWACTACSKPADGDTSSFDGNRQSASYWSTTGGTLNMSVAAQPGVAFPAGNFAGALMNIPDVYGAAAWTFATFLDGVAQETRNPANASGGDPLQPSAGDDFYGFTTALPFDEVRISVDGSGGLNPPPIAIYEFCGTR